MDLEDSTLGHLKCYESDHKWVADVAFRPDHSIEVIIEFPKNDDNPAIVIEEARRWLTRVIEREGEYRAWTAEKLVDGRWNKEESMTAADITLLLRLLSIVCFRDGTAELFWDDDDRLFYGHGIGTRVGGNGHCIKVGVL